jgi:hypothetical protein
MTLNLSSNRLRSLDSENSLLRSFLSVACQVSFTLILPDWNALLPCPNRVRRDTRATCTKTSTAPFGCFPFNLESAGSGLLFATFDLRRFDASGAF